MGEDHRPTSEEVPLEGATPADVEADFTLDTTVRWAAADTEANREDRSESPATIAVTGVVEEGASPKKGLAGVLKHSVADGKVPEYFSVLLEGMNVWGDSKCSLDSRPDWFDEAKFRRGQQFANDYLFGLMLAELLSLMILFSFADGLQPLIFTGNSDTPYKAFRRYLSTVSRVRSWYEGDIWAADSVARRNLRKVRAMHAAIRKRLNGKLPPSPGELSLEGRGEATWSTVLDRVRKDFRSACPFGAANMFYSVPRDRILFVNQADMGLTQFGFVGLMLVYPERFGAAGASEADLDGFAHLWRTVGHLLGIEDRYNFCAGSLAEVRRRSEAVIKLCARPSLRDVTVDWEHMSRCMVEGVSYYVTGLNFKTSLYYLTQVVGVESPHLYAAMTVWQRFMFYVMWFVMCYVLRIPGALAFHNWLLRLSIKKAETAPPERLAQMENRRYPYQDCKPTICTRL